MGRKLGARLLYGGAGSPSNTLWPRTRPTSVSNFILIHPIVWPQYTNIIDRQDRTTVDSIGRTVLQTVAQKLMCITPTVIVNSQHLPANLLDAVLKSKLMSFTYIVLAEYWGLIYSYTAWAPGPKYWGGLEPLGPHEVGAYGVAALIRWVGWNSYRHMCRSFLNLTETSACLRDTQMTCKRGFQWKCTRQYCTVGSANNVIATAKPTLLIG